MYTALKRNRYAVLISAMLGWMFDGFEIGLFPLIARPALRDLLQTSDDALIGFWMGNITALFLVGAALGGVLFGWLGDRWGRVKSLTLAVALYSIFTGLCALATTPLQISILRFIAALGMGGEWSLGIALVMEWWPDKNRPLLAGSIACVINIGFALIPLCALFSTELLTNWRLVMLIGASPALLTLFVRFFVPESEKWKASNHRSMQDLFSKAYVRPILIAVSLASVTLMGTWSSIQWIPMWVDQMVGGTMPQAKAYAQIVYACGATPGAFFAPLATRYIDRKPLFFILCSASLISCLTFFHLAREFNALFLFGIAIVGCLTSSLYGWLALYLPELFPTHLRATGQGFCFNFGRVFAAFGALATGQLIQIFHGSYATAGATMCWIYLLGLLIIPFAPRTDAQPLPA